MATAMVHGLIAEKVCLPQNIICYSASGKTANALALSTGIRQAQSLSELLREADPLVVAFKPQHLGSLAPEVAALTAGKLVLSVLAGKTLSRLTAAFPLARNWVRTMPNTPGRIGAGITGWCSSIPLTNDDRQFVRNVLGALGREIQVTESEMDAITAVSGSGPGYIFEFAAAFVTAAQQTGLSAEQAQLLVVETLLGSARLLARIGEHPIKLRNQVTSPNGTTLAGLRALEAGGFSTLITNAVQAAQARAREISTET